MKQNVGTNGMSAPGTAQIPAIGLTPRELLTYSMLVPLRRPPLRAAAQQVRERVRWSRARVEALQVQRFREVLEVAERTPYYGPILRASGVCAAKLKRLDDVVQLPLLGRDVVRERREDMTDPLARPSDWHQESTGGTTGTPVTVRLDRRAMHERLLVNHRMYALMGKTLGTPTLLLAGAAIDHKAWTSFKSSVKNSLFGVTVRSAFELDSRGVRTILREVAQGRYRFVIAYASVLDLLAEYADEPLPASLGLRVIPTAELVSAVQRERWRERLGAETFEVYGSREMTSIAGETPDHHGLVINGDIFHVEITDDEGVPMPEGMPGIITVTALVEKVMPMIRYQLGDMGRLLPGLPDDPYPFPRLEVTHGRVLDVIRTRAGKLLPGEYFPHLFKEVSDAVSRFQVVQHTLDHLVMRIVPTPRFGEPTRAFLTAHVQQMMGDEVRVEVELVDAIETAASGKYRPTMSYVRGRVTSHGFQ